MLVSTTSQVYHDGRDEVDPLNPQILEVLRSSDPGYPMEWDPEMDTFQVVGELQSLCTVAQRPQELSRMGSEWGPR